jgi:pilus assembly protein CpaE
MHTPMNTISPAGRSASAFPSGVTIVASDRDIAILRDAAAPPEFGEVRLIALPVDTPLADDVLSSARVLVIEVDPANPQSLHRIEAARETSPRLPIIAALRDATVPVVRSLVRQGLADVAQLPFEPGELAAQILDAAAGLAREEGKQTLAPMITVAGSTGGCGATTVLSHLAAALARTGAYPRGVCVVDLDMQSGEVAYYVGQSPRVTVSALLDAGGRLDVELLRSAITNSTYGFSILAAPETITALDEVDPEQLFSMLALVRQEFDCVLVDLPADWSGWALSVALASDQVLLVTELSVAGLRQARRRLDLFSSIGVADDAVRIVVNRVERKLFRPIGIDEAGEVLGKPVTATLADEDDAMNSAQNEGHLITDVHRHCKFGSDIEALARAMQAKGR